jgi:hypothetical protein
MRTFSEISRLGRVLLGVAVAASCLTAAGPLHAQTTLADPEAYRDAKSAATSTFLDRGRSQEERLAAAENLGYPDDATLIALLSIGTDRSQGDPIRWEALRRLQYDDLYIDAVLKILEDPDDGSEELDANLIEDLTRRTVITPPAQVRQRIQSVLRKLLDDKRDKVRLNAYRSLVSNHDPMAINLLAESLRAGRDIPIALFEAINLLDLDASINHIGALRPYIHHEDPRVQARAARALAVDPESRQAIVELVKNPKTPEEVRLHALRALAREDGQFASYAIPLVEDTRETPAIRSAAMQTFVGRMNYNKLDPADQVRFAQAVEKLAADPGLRTAEGLKVKEAARELHAYLLQVFPEIQKFYERQ